MAFIVKLGFFIALLSIFSNSVHGNQMQEKKPSAYLQYVDEIIQKCAREIENEFNLVCIGDGGQMPNDIEYIEIMFAAYRKGTFEEARKLEVSCIQKLLKHINEHQKIRPFLRQYPFTSGRIEVCIMFKDPKTNGHFENCIVDSVSSVHDKIYYNKFMTSWEKPAPFTNLTKYKIERDPNKQRKVERLETILEEPFEEAVKKLQK